jgi:RHS repeat-associated protein
MTRRIAILLALLFVTSGLAAQELQRYRVTLDSNLTSDPAGLAERLARMCAGRIEPYAETGFTGFVLLARSSAVQVLRSHPMVLSVELMSDSTMPAPPAAPEISVVAPAARSASAPRQVQTHSTTSWSTGNYSYDGAGNITAIGTDTYVYDVYGRLTSGTAGPGRTSSYTYDRFGNMLTMTLDGSKVTYGVDRDTNQVTSTTDANGLPVTYGTYDDAGRMTQMSDGSRFEYDSIGMIRKSWGTPDGKTKIYIYTPSDERIGSMVLSGTSEQSSEWTLRDPSGKVVRRVEKSADGSGGWKWTWRQDYIYRESDLVASEIDAPPYTLHYFNDHLGSPRLVTGNGGVKIALHTYFPFGSEATPVASQGGGSYGSYDRLKFTGHERDASMLDYMHARYYSAGWGRFLSPDPVMLVAAMQSPQQWNRYSYVANSPLAAHDPTGKTLKFVTDDIENFRRVEAIANQKLHGYRLVIGPTGLARLVRTRAQGPETQEQERFRQGLQRVIGDLGTTFMGVTSQSGAALAGDFDSGVIDVADIAKFGTDEPMSAASVLGHEIMEQFAKDVLDRKLYSRAHGYATHHEGMFSGWHRVTPETVGRNGVADIYYTRDGQSVDVRIYYFGRPTLDVQRVEKREVP